MWMLPLLTSRSKYKYSPYPVLGLEVQVYRSIEPRIPIFLNKDYDGISIGVTLDILIVLSLTGIKKL